MTTPRVRFSPAPTGSLHVGSVRTALFNWLFARGHGAEMRLRIEDTDVTRSRQEWIDGIESALRWLGLDWDGEPVLQSRRFDVYLAAADRLLAAGRAYACFCRPEEVEARAAEARAAGRPPGYDGRCRDLSDDDRARLAAEDRPRSIRMRTPDEGRSTFVDLVRGEVAVEWSTVSDFVIVRSNGTPVFFLANAVDDADMGITHVIRGEDLIDSTHRVRLLRAALGEGDDGPHYAHLPLLVGEDRAKLSKRHGAVSIEEFRARGYLPEALRNYLALLGWAPEDGREILTVDELAGEFDLGRVTHSAAYFDYKKLDWMNGEYVRHLDRADLVARVLPFAEARYGEQIELPVFEAAVGLAQERATTLVQIADQCSFLFVQEDDFVVGLESWERVLGLERVGDVYDAVVAHLERCDWTPEAIDLRPVVEALGLKPRKSFPAVFAAVQGSTVGLPLFDAIHLLGRERTLHRVLTARSRLP